MNKISFVIPCYRSEKTIQDVAYELREVMLQRPQLDYEIILVNDGSPDNVWLTIERLCVEDAHIKGVCLFRNFGQANAQMAGLNHATGDAVVFLDDDGQCPADQLFRLLQPLEEGCDVSVARYPKKKQSLFKNFGSYVNRWMACWLLELPTGFVMSNFFAISRSVAEEICNYKNPYPYFTGLIFRVTHDVASVEMEERERTIGTTGYTLKKLLALWMNGFTNFSTKPLRLASFVGTTMAAGGFIWGFVIVLRKILGQDIPMGYSSLMACILFIGGLIMFMLGLIGEYVGRIFICLNNTPQYIVRECKGFDEENEATNRQKNL